MALQDDQRRVPPRFTRDRKRIEMLRIR